MRFIMPLLTVLAVLAAPALADTLDGAGISAALTGQRLVYDDGTEQSFNAAGGTLFFARDGSQSSGQWAVKGDQYCSVWPPSGTWACYDMRDDGGVVVFIAADGSETAGRVKE